ncbi:MAG: glycosyltransferase family 2 protein [Candidatus Shapirobacteria bacterium]|nr:glycosyltransferase family 2 protein [Candidatus Shapirobacteria bacterium]
MKKITIGVPCFNEEENVVWAYKTIKEIVDKDKKYDYEFLFVDNGSSDKTRLLIEKIAKKDRRVKGVFLSRNFGPEASGQALTDYSTGDAVIFLPCDLQDPPELMPKLIKRWNDGYDIVLGQYTKTEDSRFMTLMRKSFYGLFKKISNIDVPTNVTGFGLVSRNVIEALKSLPEKYRFNRGLMMWVGFKRFFIPYQKRVRKNGISSYHFFDYIKHSERGLFGFSYLPLDLIVYFGLVITILSFLFIIGYLFTVFVFGNPIKASIPLMLAIVFFGGVNLMALSIIGKYVPVIMEETKNRPVYIVDEKINFKD